MALKGLNCPWCGERHVSLLAKLTSRYETRVICAACGRSSHSGNAWSYVTVPIALTIAVYILSKTIGSGNMRALYVLLAGIPIVLTWAFASKYHRVVSDEGT